MNRPAGVALRLGLGTVQFGIPYGGTKARGQVLPDAARAILRLATEYGIDLFDTAPVYGTAEELLGESVPPAAKIVTKTSIARRHSFTSDDIAASRGSLRESLRRLRRSQLYGLLVHSPDDLQRPGGERIVELLLELRSQDVVQKVGVSVYTQAQLEHCLRRYSFDLYQVPVSYIDQRLIRSGLLAEVARSGAEIHARSLFLQGVMLVGTEELPEYFSPWRGRLEQIRSALAHAGVHPAMAALTYVRSRTPVDYAIVGVASVQELQQLMLQPSPKAIDLPFEQFAIDDERLIDPSRWPAFSMPPI